jgi:HEAT repeat protein
MQYHLEPPLFDPSYFGWTNGRRILWSERAEEYYDRLIDLLVHPQPHLRAIAADQLGKLRVQRAVQPLIASLEDTHWLVRLHAARALGRIGAPKATAVLIIALSDRHRSVRRRAAQALGKVAKSTDAVAALTTAVDDPDRIVRYRATAALGEIASAEAVTALVKAIQHIDSNVSWQAAHALRWCGVMATEPLLTVLPQLTNEAIIYRVIKTLGYISDSRAVKILNAFLDHPNEEIRFRTSYALRQISWKRQQTTR